MGELLEQVRVGLAAAGDPERALGQQAYMKSQMPYHGVTSAGCREVFAPIFAALDVSTEQLWTAAVRELWRGAAYREERYAAVALTGHRKAMPYQTPNALSLYEEMIVTGAWWDFVDLLASRRVGDLLGAHPASLRPTMLAWSRDRDMWKARTSIICQLRFKEHTDLELLTACIEPSLGSREFFLRKAIGWALRQYAWTDPEWVVGYVAAHESSLSPLSRREALKNVQSAGPT
jgi:3-methyladenine DNA glycosylase AlkD